MPRSVINARGSSAATRNDKKLQERTSTDTVSSVFSSKTKDERIQAEYNRLLVLFEDVDPNKLDFVRVQVYELAFLNVSIADLHADIIRNGTMIQYSNGGGQEGYRQNPDLKTLVDFQKLTNSIVRALLPLVPNKQDLTDADLFYCEDP